MLYILTETLLSRFPSAEHIPPQIPAPDLPFVLELSTPSVSHSSSCMGKNFLPSNHSLRSDITNVNRFWERILHLYMVRNHFYSAIASDHKYNFLECVVRSYLHSHNSSYCWWFFSNVFMDKSSRRMLRQSKAANNHSYNWKKCHLLYSCQSCCWSLNS